MFTFKALKKRNGSSYDAWVFSQNAKNVLHRGPEKSICEHEIKSDLRFPGASRVLFPLILLN